MAEERKSGPALHGIHGVQGGSGTTLVTALVAIAAAKDGEKILVAPRPGDEDSLRLYLGVDGETLPSNQPPPPSGTLTAHLLPSRLDGLWLLSSAIDATDIDMLKQFRGDRVIVDTPAPGLCEQVEWVGRPEPSGISRLRDQVSAAPDSVARVWLNGERDADDQHAAQQLHAYWVQARGMNGITVTGLPWHEGAWMAQRNRQNLLAAGWSILRDAAFEAMEQAQ